MQQVIVVLNHLVIGECLEILISNFSFHFHVYFSDEEFVVVRSQQALLQERIQHLVNANGVLEYSKRGLEQQLGTVSKELDLVKKINYELENQIVNYGKEVQQLSDLIKEKDNEIQQVIDKLKDVESRNSNLEQQLFKRDSDLQVRIM